MKILEKLKKLIKHEESARRINNVAEADAFAQKIQALIDKYNFSDQDLVEESDVNFEVLIDHLVEPWCEVLISNLSNANSCQSLASTDCIAIVGTKTDRGIVRSLFEYFSKLFVELAEREVQRLSVNPYSGIMSLDSFRFHFVQHDIKRHRENYLLGLVTAIGDRLMKTRDESINQEANNHPESVALVRIERKSQDVVKFIEKEIPDVDLSDRLVDVDDNSAFHAGVRLGNEIALTEKVLGEKV